MVTVLRLWQGMDNAADEEVLAVALGHIDRDGVVPHVWNAFQVLAENVRNVV